MFLWPFSRHLFNEARDCARVIEMSIRPSQWFVVDETWHMSCHFTCLPPSLQCISSQCKLVHVVQINQFPFIHLRLLKVHIKRSLRRWWRFVHRQQVALIMFVACSCRKGRRSNFQLHQSYLKEETAEKSTKSNESWIACENMDSKTVR